MIRLELVELGGVIAMVVLSLRLASMLSPVRAVRLLTVALSATCVVLTATLLLIAVTGLGELRGWHGEPVDGLHHSVPLPVGLVAALLLARALWAGARTLQHQRRVEGSYSTLGGVEVRDLGHPTAFAVPGTPGAVLVDQRLWFALDPKERSVLVAHEYAHLHAGHHRHLALANIAEAMFWPLRSLAVQLRLVLERVADESAADRLGDRVFVGRTVARAALLCNGAAYPAHIDGGDTLQRVSALLRPAPRASSLAEGADTVSIGMLAVLAMAQIGHLTVLVWHLA